VDPRLVGKHAFSWLASMVSSSGVAVMLWLLWKAIGLSMRFPVVGVLFFSMLLFRRSVVLFNDDKVEWRTWSVLRRFSRVSIARPELKDIREFEFLIVKGIEVQLSNLKVIRFWRTLRFRSLG
jgi:hypothetical protein